MTAQIGDIYKHKDKEYTLVSLSADIPFDPVNFGMEPHCSTTACWSGYWCKYVISNQKLKLDELYLHNNEGKYPPINGVEVDPAEFEEWTCHTSKGPVIRKTPKYHGHRVYRNIGLPIPYTGKILLGYDFIPDYYIHMGFQRYWSYKELLEFIFENGVLVETHDYSALAAEKRKQMEQEGIDPRHPEFGDIPSFVEKSFSLDYEDKAPFSEDDD